MDTKPMSQVLKTAPEVTSLSATDRVLIADANGEPKRIKIADALANKSSKEFSSEISDWYTIAQFDKTLAYGGILCISSGEWIGSPTLNVFAIGGVYSAGNARKPKIQSLLGPTALIKLRVVLDGNSIRIDAYSNNRFVNIYVAGILPLCEIIVNPSIPSGATIWEFDFSSSVFGGVNRCPSTLYAILQKGGLRDGDETADQRADKEQSHARSFPTEYAKGLQPLFGGWVHRCDKRGMDKLSRRGIPIRSTRLLWSFKLSSPRIFSALDSVPLLANKVQYGNMGYLEEIRKRSCPIALGKEVAA